MGVSVLYGDIHWVWESNIHIRVNNGSLLSFFLHSSLAYL